MRQCCKLLICNLPFSLKLGHIKGKLKIDQLHEIYKILWPEESVPLERNVEIFI